VIGVDMGLEYFATLSNGEHLDNPRWYRQQAERLGILQKRRARCKRGSKDYRELTRLIRKTHEMIANSRRDFHHKASHLLVDPYSLIAVESLNIKGLARSHVAKSMHDAGWAQFLYFLSYKAESAGAQVVEVDARHTSQVCSRCGVSVPKSLDVRWHDCPECGLSLQRDVNAARNVLGRASLGLSDPVNRSYFGRSGEASCF
jgi:putative transposase